MATTTLNTRIQLKYDTYENWTTNNPVLLAGEAAVCVVPADAGSGLNEPAILLKFGDGTSSFTELSWASATAADVIPSLKGINPTLPATSITGLEDFIAGEIQDTNTTYQLIQNGDTSFKLQSKENSSAPWVDVSTITITYTLTEGTANGTVAFNGTEVAVHGLGSAAYTESSAYAPAGAGVPSTEGVPTDYLLSPSGWIAPPSGGGSNELITLADFTIEGDAVASIVIDKDPSGKPFRVRKIYFLILPALHDGGATGNFPVWIYVGSTSTSRRVIATIHNPNAIQRGISGFAIGLPGFAVGSMLNFYLNPSSTDLDGIDGIPYFEIRSIQTDSFMFRPGTIVKVYGQEVVE